MRVAARADAEAVWQEVECGGYDADLPLWRELTGACERQPCELLDLGAGVGRVSLALAGPACRVTALDADAGMIEALRRRSRTSGRKLETVVADARSFELSGHFDLVLAPMQLVQLLQTRDERIAMLSCIAAHLAPGGRAALTLLDLDEEWEAEPQSAPLPDMIERGGWVYSSQPLAVRLVGGGSAIELDRLRRAVSPDGGLSESLSCVRLALVDAAGLEREARAAGLVARERMQVPPTRDHVGSIVVILAADG